MPKVYTTQPGAVIEVGQYGPASNDVPAIVPDAVAAELAGRPDLKIERETQAPPAAPDMPSEDTPSRFLRARKE